MPQSLNRARRQEFSRAESREGADPSLSRVARLASTLLNVPMVAIFRLENGSRVFEAGLGIEPRDATGPLFSRCCLAAELVLVPDALDDVRLSTDPLVARAPRVRFLGVAPLRGEEGTAGALCVLDVVPRDLSAGQRRAFTDLAEIAALGISQPASPVAARPALLDSAPDLVLVMGRDGRVRDSGCADPEQWRGLVAMPPEARRAMLPAVGAVIDGGPTQSVEFSIGSGPARRSFEARLAGHSADTALVFVRDVEHHRRVEDWLRRLGKAVETMQIGVTITDTEGKIIYCNPAEAEMHGYQVEELIGRNARVFASPGADDTFHGVVQLQRWRRESVNRRKSGELFPVQLLSDIVVDAEGRAISRVTWSEDISERKLAEENRSRLLQRLITAQEEERRQISRELHDEAGQAMTSMLLKLRLIQDAPTVEEAKAMAKGLRQVMAQTMKSIAQLARGLHPSILDDLGLLPAIRRYTGEYARLNRLTVNFQTFGMESIKLPQPVEITLYRIVQEALTNIVRHADAKMIFIRLDRYQDAVGLAIIDDGRGFDPEVTLQLYAKSNQLGLFGMRERVALLGGSMEVESRVGGGTTVSVRIPLPREES
jgi:PAS domain S-box-containing protein